MPKQTFYNLSEDKQKTIIDAARNEFSIHSFYDASINQIIKDAGISRGSFYQYFENKEDVYLSLFEQCSTIIVGKTVELIKGKTLDVFELHILIFDQVIRMSQDKTWSSFIKNTITNINIKLITHLEKYIFEEHRFQKHDQMISFINWDNIRLTDQMDRLILHNMLISTMMFLVGNCLNDLDNVEKYRGALIKQFEMIKDGVSVK
ncbi:transcriptional regulator, TetR family [Lachnospiraceae bacterium KM106-2]|nr:transcriptional regulator, TetR family [Lachnospiraceae bacterium KM106-2]